MPAKLEASALFEFLGRVDRELAAPSIIFLIGGSAVSIIDPAHSTSDVDLLSPGSVEFDAAVARLGARGEPVLPIQVVGIAEGPEGLEERAQKIALEGATQLTVLVPERHDLAIMKLARGYEHDLQALEDIHRLHPFEVETLVARYQATEVVGPRRRFALALLDLVARLFGDDEANKHRPLLAKLAW